ANIADDAVAEALFGPHHPYGRLALGTTEGVERLSRSDLIEFHRAWYRPRGSFLIIAGDFDPATIRHTLDRSFADWASQTPPAPSLPEAAPAERGAMIAIEWPDAAQAEIRFAGLGM